MNKNLGNQYLSPKSDKTSKAKKSAAKKPEGNYFTRLKASTLTQSLTTKQESK